MKRSPMQRCGAMLAASLYRPTRFQHQVNSFRIIVLSRMGELLSPAPRECLDELRLFSQKVSAQLLIVQFESNRELQFIRTVFEQQFDYFFMPKVARDGVSR